jgi:hypothetical protein
MFFKFSTSIAVFSGLAVSNLAFAEQVLYQCGPNGAMGIGDRSEVPIGCRIIRPWLHSSSSLLSIKLSQNDVHVSNDRTPFQIATMGYQGAFKAQGIPAAQLYCIGVRNGDISPLDIVSAAFTKGTLDQQFAEDDEFTITVGDIADIICRD